MKEHRCLFSGEFRFLLFTPFLLCYAERDSQHYKQPPELIGGNKTRTHM